MKEPEMPETATVTPIRPPDESKTEILTKTFGPLFAKALVGAQKQVQRVAKDGFNKFHQYAYTTGDAMIEAAREALNENGLALLNTGWERRGDRITVQYTLLHESGEHIDGETSTPVIPEKGRPEDKAEFGALTENIAYFLRGILQIPRGNSDDTPSARDDRGRGGRDRQQRGEPAQRPEQNPPAQRSSPSPNAPPPEQAGQAPDPDQEKAIEELLADKEIAARFDTLNASLQRRKTTVQSYGCDRAKVLAALDQAIAKKAAPAEAKAPEPKPVEQKPAEPKAAAPTPKPPSSPPARRPPPAPVDPKDIPF